MNVPWNFFEGSISFTAPFNPLCPVFGCDNAPATEGNGRRGRDRANVILRDGVGRLCGPSGPWGNLARGEGKLGDVRIGLKGDEPETIVAVAMFLCV